MRTRFSKTQLALFDAALAHFSLQDATMVNEYIPCKDNEGNTFNSANGAIFKRGEKFYSVTLRGRVCAVQYSEDFARILEKQKALYFGKGVKAVEDAYWQAVSAAR